MVVSNWKFWWMYYDKPTKLSLCDQQSCLRSPVARRARCCRLAGTHRSTSSVRCTLPACSMPRSVSRTHATRLPSAGTLYVLRSPSGAPDVLKPPPPRTAVQASYTFWHLKFHDRKLSSSTTFSLIVGPNLTTRWRHYISLPFSLSLITRWQQWR